MRFLTAMVIALMSAAQPARAEEGANLGKRCNAHADCLAGLRCLESACVDEATMASRPARETSDGARPFFGGVLGAALPVIWNNGGSGSQLAMRAGAIVNGTFQFQVEVSPATAMVGLSPSAFSLFDAIGSVGVLVPISDMVSWIVRFGGGGGFLFGLPTFGLPSTSSSGEAFGEFRGDVAGVAIRPSKHLLLECNAPSFRVMVMERSFNNVMLMWVTNVTVGYVF